MSSHERSDSIRRDIEQTRADMDETVDQLEHRVSPGQLLDQAWSMFRTSGRGAGDVVRDHPVPLAIMGLGVAWLAIEKATGSRHERHGHVGAGTYEPAEGRVGPYLGDAIAHEKGRGVKGRVKEGIGGAAGTVKEKVRGATGWVAGKIGQAGHGASDVAHRAGGTMSHAGDAVRHRAGDVTHGIGSFIDSSPLAAGAIAFGLGLVAGYSAPGSGIEDRLMGDTADTVKRSVSGTVKEVGTQARRVAKDAGAAARTEADRQNLPGSLKQSAKRVADEAWKAAKQTAESESLSAEGLKTRARTLAEDVKLQVRRRASKS